MACPAQATVAESASMSHNKSITGQAPAILVLMHWIDSALNRQRHSMQNDSTAAAWASNAHSLHQKMSVALQQRPCNRKHHALCTRQRTLPVRAIPWSPSGHVDSTNGWASNYGQCQVDVGLRPFITRRTTTCGYRAALPAHVHITTMAPTPHHNTQPDRGPGGTKNEPSRIYVLHEQQRRSFSDRLHQAFSFDEICWDESLFDSERL